jgi:hypothetical protein
VSADTKDNIITLTGHVHCLGSGDADVSVLTC